MGQLAKAFDAAIRASQIAESQGIHRLSRKRDSLQKLKALFEEVNDLEGQIRCLSQLVDLARESSSDETPDAFWDRMCLATALRTSGNQDEASRVAREALEDARRIRSGTRVVASEYWDRIVMAKLCLLSESTQEAAEKATALMADAQEFRSEAGSYGEPIEQGIRAHVLEIYGRLDDAIACAKKEMASVPVDWYTRYQQCEINLIRLLKAAGRSHEARQVLEDGVRDRIEKYGEEHYVVDLARLELARLLFELANYEDAEKILEHASNRLLENERIPVGHKCAMTALLADLCERRGNHQEEASWRLQLANLEKRRADKNE
jgi:tetratricopeptide (TPR) repeat protein